MVCCVTGHRPKGFPFSRDEDDLANVEYEEVLRQSIVKLVHQGYFDFVAGMAEGADMDFAETVLFVKNSMEYDCITMEAALPCPVSMPQKPTVFHYRRDAVLKACDRVTAVSPCYHKGCMQKRNQYMVDKADLVLAIWNGECSGGTWGTIKYARKRNKPILYIMLKKMGCYEDLDSENCLSSFLAHLK